MPLTYTGTSSGTLTGTWSTHYTGATTGTSSWITVNWTGSTTAMYTAAVDGWFELGSFRDDDSIRTLGDNNAVEHQRSPEERQRRDREYREHIERRTRERQEREEANERAQTLLLSFLSVEQQAQFEQDGYFYTIGSAGGRYRIRQGLVGNIDWYQGENERGGSLCCHPINESLPLGDIMLAQMLALVTDEPGFVRLANRYSGVRHPLAIPRRIAANV